MTHPFELLRQNIEDELTSVKKLSQKNFHFPCFQDMLPRLRRLIGLQYRRLVNELSLFKIVGLWTCSWLLPHEQAICFNSLIWLSRNKSVQKSRFFTLHFSKKSESIFFHFALLEKEWKLFVFTFHFSNFKNPLSLVPGPCLSVYNVHCSLLSFLSLSLHVCT